MIIVRLHLRVVRVVTALAAAIRILVGRITARISVLVGTVLLDVRPLLDSRVARLASCWLGRR